MPQLYTCPLGHEWEDPFGGDGASSGAVFCPTCGVAVEVAAAPPPVATPSLAETPDHGPTTESALADAPSAGPRKDVAEQRTQTFGDLDAAAASTAAQVSATPPVTVAGYDILSELGRGGMGVVYKARQRNLGRLVALKMIRGGAHAEFDDMFRFRAEAEAVARLQHPNIVQIYEVGTQEGSPYFSMELVDGENLAWHVADKLLPARRSAELIETLARAMAFAHQRGIVHRDLKPGNILMTAEGVPKITDFGLAKRLDDDASQTRTGAVLGTPSYMSPEQAWGKTKEIGPGTDVYALGAILYELLVGRPPFTGETPVDTLVQVRYEEPLPPVRLQPNLPVDLETICLKCLEKETHKRYVDARALADDLRRFLEGEPIEARPIRVWERSLKWAKRRPAVAGLLAVSVLAIFSLLSSSLYYNVALQRRYEETQRERQRAEDNFQKALQAVDQMLTEVSEAQLASEPRMEQKRRALLEKALAFYTEFLRERGSDVAVRKETALAYRRVADITRLLGQLDRAERAYTQAIDLFEQLTAEYPDESAYRAGLADSYNFRGETLRTLGRVTPAQQSYDHALKIQDELVREFPDKVDYQLTQARTHYNLGLLWRDSNRPGQAETAFRKAIEILARLTAQHPGIPAYPQELARSHLNLGPVLRVTGRTADAQDTYREAVRLLQELIDKHPRAPEYKHELAVAYNNQGNLFGTIGSFPEAVAAHQRALDLFAKLVADFPNVPDYRKELANTYNSLAFVWALTKKPSEAERDWKLSVTLYEGLVAEFPDVADYQGGLGRALGNLGWLLLDGKNFAGARDDLSQAIPHLAAALKPNPSNPSHLQTLRNAYHNLAEALLQLGDHAAAARAAAALSRVYPDRAADSIVAAGILARCVPLAERDPTLSGPERLAGAQDYGNRAMTHLREAFRQGFKDREAIANNGFFLPLQSRADFQKLVNHWPP